MPEAHGPADLSADLDDVAYQRALAVLLDTGTALAVELKSPSDRVTVADRADAFERVARAVRRTIILSRHLADTAPAREAKRTFVRKQVIRAVEDEIQRHAKRPTDAEPLRAELLERIDAPEFEEDLVNRSPETVIAELCRDLGLANLLGARPALRRTPDDIAILCAKAAAPTGSGLPQWTAAASPQAQRNDNACNDTSLSRFLLKER